jgi:lipopolysaccharide/colanic/teichoic acid biosynthesis glycosyltransferase
MIFEARFSPGWNIRRLAAAAADSVVAGVSLYVAFLLRGNFSLDGIPTWPLVEATLLAGIAGALAFRLTGTNLALWRYVTIRDFGTLLAGATAAVLGFLALMFLWNRLQFVPRAVPVIQWLVLVVGLCGLRLAYATVVAAAARGAPQAHAPWQPVLLVGGGEAAALVVRLLRIMPEIGWTPVGILDERLTMGRVLNNVPILGRLGDFRRVLAGLSVRGMKPCHVIITAPHDEIDASAVRKLHAEAVAVGIGVSSVPDLLCSRGQSARNAVDESERFDAALARLQSRSQLAAKRLIDIVVSAAVLIAAVPVMAVIAVLLRSTVGTPALFHQLRGGRGGQPFVMVKFRTMAETYGSDGRLLPAAARTPWLGRLLRRTRLDELPQFWNVLLGNMSIVGPRPLVANELAELADGGAERSSIRPGITGWAQVHGGQFLDLHAKAALDVWYARHASLVLDLRILLLTIRMVVMGERLDDGVLDRVQAAYAEAGWGGAWPSAR